MKSGFNKIKKDIKIIGIQKELFELGVTNNINQQIGQKQDCFVTKLFTVNHFHCISMKCYLNSSYC